MALGLWLTDLTCHFALGEPSPWFIAPLGASAVLLFLVPASPLAQPWSIVGGNVLSALVGVVCAHTFGHSGPVAALAGGLAAVCMYATRCLHPPGAAVALSAVLGGPAVASLGFGFAWHPVAVNSLAMLAVALLFNNATGRTYPHHGAVQTRPHDTQDRLPSHRGHLKEDLQAALASYGEMLDIDQDDLEEILIRTHMLAQRRQWGSVRCDDIMSRDVVRVNHDHSLDEAWARLAHHKVKALPVTDENDRLVGIVSMHDFFISQTAPDPRRLPTMTQARQVRDIMTQRVRTARPEQPLVELVPLFSDRGLHHMPVVDDQQRVVGIITQSDMVAALFQALPA